MKTPQHGFTLTELMAALSVLGVLVAIATPSLKQFAANSRISGSANSLVNALAVARSEALHQSTPVTVCASANSQTCVDTPDWSNGWIVFTDNAGTKGTLDSTDVLLQAWRAPGGGVTVNLNAASNYVRFDARGMNSLLAAATFTVAAHDCRDTNASQITVTPAGSPQSTKVACP
jgi:type IV fimbrial biogenesis protein FimT